MTSTLLLGCSQPAFFNGLLENAISGAYQDLNSFPEDFFDVKIRITGADFRSSINGDVAKALWEFEKNLRRAVAQALHDSSSINSLTKEERQESSLNFTVSPGSSVIKTCLKNLAKSFGKAFVNMDDRGKVAVCVIIGLTIWGLGTAWFDKDAKMAEIQAKVQMNSEENILKAFQYAQQFQEAYKESSDAIAKSVPTADSVQINNQHYSHSDIEKLNERPPRSQPEFDTFSGVYQVDGIDRLSGNNSFKVKLKDTITGQAIAAILSPDRGLFSDLNLETNAADIGKYIQDNTKVDVTILSKDTKSSNTLYILDITPAKDDSKEENKKEP